MMRIVVIGLSCIVCLAPRLQADSFDHYDNTHIRKAAASAAHAKQVKRLSREDLIEHRDVLPKLEGALLIVHTNDNRWAKLLVHPADQRNGEDFKVPLALIERFVTFKEGEERARAAEGKNIRLFPGFRFSLDIGAIVPEKGLPADLRFVEENGVTSLEPVGKAEMFLVTKHYEAAAPPKNAKIAAGAKFDMAHFNGRYLVYDDGKTPSELTLKVDAKGAVTGWMFSGATGAKYDVQGSVGPNPIHGIQFTVTLPRTVQTFTGWMLTGDASAIAGYSTLQNREAGFYAVRMKDE
jgi:hypothetical protein